MQSKSLNFNLPEDTGLNLQRYITTGEAMRLLAIDSLPTLKGFERQGLLKIHHFSRKVHRCWLPDILSIPDRLERQQQSRTTFKSSAYTDEEILTLRGIGYDPLAMTWREANAN